MRIATFGPAGGAAAGRRRAALRAGVGRGSRRRTGAVEVLERVAPLEGAAVGVAVGGGGVVDRAGEEVAVEAGPRRGPQGGGALPLHVRAAGGQGPGGGV